MLLWDLFLQVHTAIGNLQGEECEFSWKNHSEESSENFWLERRGVEPWKMKQTEVKTS